MDPSETLSGVDMTGKSKRHAGKKTCTWPKETQSDPDGPLGPRGGPNVRLRARLSRKKPIMGKKREKKGVVSAAHLQGTSRSTRKQHEGYKGRKAQKWSRRQGQKQRGKKMKWKKGEWRMGRNVLLRW